MGLSPPMLNLLCYHSHPCHHITKMRKKTHHAHETGHVFTVFPNFFENRGSVSGEPWSWIQRTGMKTVEDLFLFLITADRWQSTLFTLGVTSHKILQWEKVHLVFAFSGERTLAGFETAREAVTRVRCAVFVVFVAVEEWAQFIFVRDCKLAAAHNHISIFSAKKKENRSWGCFSRTSQTDGTLSPVSIVLKPSSSTYAVSLCCELIGVCVILFASVTVP